ncbi:hypothetical protein H4R18_005230 [Coemansia javaensis]|uniref:Thioesterase domain-containing protein n=1 Tax=Coemansia javaensis TaxID=2761396 RepID=A0A9W8H2K3_9FUNG|nr:hypothetical protein H4R18_005230 [Coemansia javaensis]
MGAAASGNGDDDDEFRRLVAETARKKDSVYYYAAGLQASVVGASRAERTATVELTVGPGEICSAGCLDEGLAGTIADYWTSALITAVNGDRSALTTALSVQVLKPVVPSTAIRVVCTATEAGAGEAPHATARFVLASDPTHVLATAAHTKFFKPLPGQRA